MYRNFLKRGIDFCLAFIALLLLSPVMVVTAILVHNKLGSPVLFKQLRPGKNEKIFAMYKFRSMTDERDEDGNLLADSVRLTDFGKKLRSTSLDELPELFNIIKGDMSFVGPRPLLIDYLKLYDEKQKQRHQVRPGLTGLAQVNGRNATTWKERFNYDIYYANHVSLWLDIKILVKTVKTVLTKDGINNENAATMVAFKGNEVDED
ncbi:MULTISPECIES: sugar transferase [Aerococcus]|uniref:Sugar transferase n=1 Tax=Aerococcus sanguinicola TaxID=119206 RepID=A0A5N1GUF4_9LACT|nr:MULTISPECIES: sugar transferase [Aerococcus]KAA9302220.1 sugar transferase [Aerococcus sanguinicola]MDK6368351.1 sugar transferase [Aerococcus sp. UMB9870]MDK6679433.1 sugar transferase [Aerococcus sp. UMB8608]MDK6687198.1 sugar transferase [Aerococcus sp. UMB8623]MDK6941103.1 sugar transferase [Aerococcus sp. UMB8487]